MRYVSTRGESPPLTFTEAVATGLAPDRGLYVPENLPSIRSRLKDWASLDYSGLCVEFFRLFATDVPVAELTRMVKASYRTFSHPQVAPLVKLEDSLHVLELFHGPTLAFKDFALQLLGNLYEAQIARSGVPINVLGATSGDTGSAAIHGLLGKNRVRLFILYPRGRVSPLQERQMTTTGASNVYPLAIEGSFDDGQRIVKELFGDAGFKQLYNLSAINSINLARILAQCVYYIWAWLRLPEKSREGLEFVVPTGNFGNVLAGWMTQQMGLPVESFRVAVNQNDILHRFFTTGTYTQAFVRPSQAPSMDIQVASNFERYIYYMLDQDTAEVRRVMEEFRTRGDIRFSTYDPSTFTSSTTDDAGIVSLIRKVYDRYGYVADPHTACGFNLPEDGVNRCILATAHPAKFPDVIHQSLGIACTAPALEALKELPIINYLLPTTERAIREFIEEHARSGGLPSSAETEETEDDDDARE